MIGVTVLTAGSYFSSILCRNSYYVSDVETFGTFQTISDEYLPNGVDGAPQYMPEDTLWYSDGIMVSAHEKNGTNYRLELTNSSAETQYVELPMLYYRGYRAKDLGTGNLIGLEAGENGRIRLYVDGGYQGEAWVYFQEPISWRISEMISLAALFAVGVYLFVQYRRKCQKSGESR